MNWKQKPGEPLRSLPWPLLGNRTSIGDSSVVVLTLSFYTILSKKPAFWGTQFFGALEGLKVVW